MSAASRLQTQLIAAVTSGRRKDVPEAGRLVWSWYCTLSRTRSYTMSGPAPITLSEIEAFARLYRWQLEPRHVDTLLTMDAAYLEQAYAKTAAGNGIIPAGKRQNLTAAAFDAVFG